MPIEIVDHDPGWGLEFDRLADEIRGRLGATALRVDHIGSTAVPGLAAKDVIDVQVAVAALDPEPLAEALVGCGLILAAGIDRDHVPPGAVSAPAGWQKLLFRSAPGRRPAHVHVRVLGAPNWRYALLFRDHLRAHPATAAAYAELKLRLAALDIDRGTYSDVKDPACDLIIAAAERWAEAVGWQPPGVATPP
ncbi:MAG: hypothetical protein QOJ31_1162 [Gaiellales bacterium]|nr:hypothetical protein [Gaiellales bacterium]